MREWRLATTGEISSMTFDEAKEIVERQIELGHKTGDWRPREHLTKAMEIILEMAMVTNGIVYCKDCEFRTISGNCGHPRHESVLPTAYPNDFCSYGVLRGDK